MMRLIKRGLMFGNLVEVSSPALVKRYNRALEHLTGKTTKLTEFHIDICGYSPEVGHELGDDLYLNPDGCNQQFILLTTEQKSAPLLMSQFSMSHAILKDFIEDNESQLFALTAREAVSGELMNSVFEIHTPADLLQIHQIHIEADTIEERMAGAEALKEHIKTFMEREDAWWDDVLIAKMIELARQTGDIHRNPIGLKPKRYTLGNYYTTHFGGLYIFRDTKVKAVISRKLGDDRVEGMDTMGVDLAVSFHDRAEIAHFLFEHNLIELIVSAPDERDAAILRQKLDFIVIATAAEAGFDAGVETGDDISKLSRRDIRALERKYGDRLPPEYEGLMAIWRWASLGGDYPRLDPDHPAYFYALRATVSPDKDLVNMLLADLSPLDFRQLFICHKQAFYARYKTYPDAKKDYVARFLEDEYLIDKAGAREALFGAEPDMSEPPSSRRNPWRAKTSENEDQQDDTAQQASKPARQTPSQGGNASKAKREKTSKSKDKASKPTRSKKPRSRTWGDVRKDLEDLEDFLDIDDWRKLRKQIRRYKRR